MIFFDFGAFDFGGGRRLDAKHVMLTKVVTLSALSAFEPSNSHLSNASIRLKKYCLSKKIQILGN